MALFQVSVLKNYLKLQDDQVVDKAYKKFTSYFQHPEIQENIRKSKEEQFQATRLEHITNNIHNAVGQLKTMGLAAHPSYIDAVCFYLVVMQERAYRFTSNQRGEFYNMIVLIMQAREYQASEVPKLWKEWNLQNYKVISLRPPYFTLFWNGKRLLTSSSTTECQQYILTHNDSHYRIRVF